MALYFVVFCVISKYQSTSILLIYFECLKILVYLNIFLKYSSMYWIVPSVWKLASLLTIRKIRETLENRETHIQNCTANTTREIRKFRELKAEKKILPIMSPLSNKYCFLYFLLVHVCVHIYVDDFYFLLLPTTIWQVAICVNIHQYIWKRKWPFKGLFITLLNIFPGSLHNLHGHQ